ncbi:MAG: hypothetical protein K0R65_1961 [Crocinitomicaceae bacterium]|jgi:hypothetical protein|nr:hypothetical protein [Crocinitomicaceae bacterium]
MTTEDGFTPMRMNENLKMKTAQAATQLIENYRNAKAAK